MVSALQEKHLYARKKVTREKYDYIYLSPHLDDVSFSCSGAICHNRQQGLHVLIATLFAGEPRPPFSPLARAFHQLWQIPAGFSPYQVRKAEDERAMEALGVDYLWLNWLDIIYRDHHLSQWDDLNSYETLFDNDSAFLSLRQWLTDLHASYPDSTIVAPLGVGGHRDHCLVFQAALQALDPAQLLFFEDFPYAAYAPEKTPELVQLYHLSPLEIDISPYLEQRIHITGLYESQHAMIFYPPSSFQDTIKEYTRKTDRRRFVERYWQLRP